MNITDDKIVEIFKEMVQINTTNLPGNEHLMCSYIANILREEKIEYTIVETAPGRENIIARKGPSSSEAPILLISHLDVVDTKDQNWSYPPFSAKEVEGIIYGRGTMDTKHLTAMELGAFLSVDEKLLKRPLYFIATADEEKGSEFGMKQIAEKYKEQFANGMVVNEGGGFYIENQHKGYYLCTLGEKGRCDVKVTIEGDSGPASFKSEHKAVDTFTQLIQKMSSYQFPHEPNEISEQFEKTLKGDIDEMFLSHFKHYNSHDAIIVNSYDIGTQINVLPYHIEFDFALQLLPGKTQEDAVQILQNIIGDTDVSWEITNFLPGFISTIQTPLYRSIENNFSTYFGEYPILPVFALGRTDGRFLGQYGCDVYGFSPVTSTIDFKKVLTLVHQVDEQIDRESIVKGTALFTKVLQTLEGESNE